MKDNDCLNNELKEDFILKKVATSLAEKDSLLFDELQNNESIINPLQDDLDKRISNIINEHFKKGQNLKKHNTIKKTLIKAAVIVLVISSGFIISFTTVDAFRVKVLNYYIENFDTHVSFKPKDEEDPFMGFRVGYIPEGYIESDEIKTPSFYSLTFFKENYMLDFTLYDSQSIFNVDSENCERYNIIINKQNGYIFRKPGSIILVFKFQGNSIVISSTEDNLTNEELVKIAESIS